MYQQSVECKGAIFKLLRSKQLSKIFLRRKVEKGKDKFIS